MAINIKSDIIYYINIYMQLAFNARSSFQMAVKDEISLGDLNFPFRE